VERARYVAARLREFRNPASVEFFAECASEAHPGVAAPAASAPFQCQQVTTPLGWRAFLRP